MKQWVRERGTNPPTFCPLDGECVVIGMNFVGSEPPGKEVGEFWYDDKDNLNIRIYDVEVDDAE